jgi:hypothetical protein
MRGIVGDLHDFDFDIRRALQSDAMRGEVGAIPGANCWCTHSCFIHDSSRFSTKVQLIQIPLAGMRQIHETDLDIRDVELVPAGAGEDHPAGQ